MEISYNWQCICFSVILNSFHPLPPCTVSTSLFFPFAPLFLPCKQIHQCYFCRFLPYVLIWHLFFSFWLTSFCVTGSQCIHLSSTDSDLFLLWLSNIPLNICTTTSSFIHLSLDIQVASMSWLLWTVLQWTLPLLLLSHLVLSDSLWPHGLQHARLSCPSPSPGASSNSCPLSRWCHPTISSSFILFATCLQSFPASEYFPRVNSSQQVAKVLEFKLQHQSFQWIFRIDSLEDWLVWSQSKGLSRVFSNTTVQKHQFFSAQFSV